MNDRTLKDMAELAETYLSTSIAPVPVVGGSSSTHGLPEGDHAGPQAAHADPSLDAAVMKTARHFEDAIVSFQKEISGLYNRLRPLKSGAPNHDALHTLLLVMQQAHGLQTELRKVAQDIHRGNWGT